jgi:hypothetical protein
VSTGAAGLGVVGAGGAVGGGVAVVALLTVYCEGVEETGAPFNLVTLGGGTVYCEGVDDVSLSPSNLTVAGGGVVYCEGVDDTKEVGGRELILLPLLFTSASVIVEPSLSCFKLLWAVTLLAIVLV